MNEELEWWWLSFTCEEKGFLGVAIVFATDFIHACKVTHALKINPGGQVSGYCFNAGAEMKVRLFDSMRLLNKEEAQKMADFIDE